MKRFTILLSLVLIAAFAMAQVNTTSKIIKDKADYTKTVKTTKDVPVWECTFDEATPLYTIGQEVGTKAWTVSDTTPSDGFTNAGYENGEVEVPPAWLYTGWRYVHDYSVSGANFAWIEGITDLIYGTVAPFESWIQFDNINLTSVNNPKVTFYQNYKVFNYDECYVDFSDDAGVTWNSVRINIKEELGGTSSYGEETLEVIATDYIANSSNASIRFRWVCTSDDADYGAGYSWQIDDINIVETPVYDVKITSGAMSFFEYLDYTDPAYAENNVYQVSGYYGNIPQAQFASEYANCWFNIAAQNMGVDAVIPVATIEIFDPEMTSIFSNTVTGVEIATNETDTIDLIETDFALGADPALGEYTVVYSVAIDAFDDEVLTNNADTSYFNITENYYGRDITGPTSSTSLNNSSAGGIDGEQFGQTFMFMWDTEITSVDVYIDGETSTDANIVLKAYQYDSETSAWVGLASSELTFIESTDLDNWINFEFTDDVNIIIDPEVGGKDILIALEMYYNNIAKEGNEVWIGYDSYDCVDAVYNHGFYTNYGDEDVWYYGGLAGGLSMRVNFNDFQINESAVPTEIANNLSIYPNPSTGILNIEGIEGADVQIINMMGQIVESVENTNKYNQIDMSNYSNGTYFVKVIIDNNVITRKINLMK